MKYFLMFNKYLDILSKGDILIILVSGLSILPHLNKYLFIRIFYVKIKKQTFFNVRVIIQ